MTQRILAGQKYGESINQSSVAATLISVGDLTGASQMNQAIRGVDLATGRPLDRDQRLHNVGHGVLGIAVTFGPQLLRPTPTGPPKTEIVQRWMSRGELEAMVNTGLLRGGRPGRNYVTNMPIISIESKTEIGIRSYS